MSSYAPEYASLDQAVRAAGFFTTPMPMSGGGHRLVCASKQRRDGGLTGNSFWVARRRGGWLLGTWGPCLYRVPDPQRLAELCIAWLAAAPDATHPDVSDEIKVRFGLMPADDDEVETRTEQERDDPFRDGPPAVPCWLL